MTRTLRGIVIAAIGMACVVQSGSRAVADDDLEKIIKAVVASEENYKNLEVNHNYLYRLETPRKGGEGSNGHLTLRQKESTHFIKQDSMFRSTGSSEAMTYYGRFIATESVSTCDGEKTRRRQNDVVNIVHDPTTSETGLEYPNTYIFAQHARGNGPLSYHLRNFEMARHHTNTLYEGEDTLDDGTKCLKLRIEKWEDGQQERDYWLIWLRPDRNYLPAKGVGYAVGYSREIPLEIATVEEWTEVEKGIWLPASIRRVINAEIAASEGETVVSNIRTDKYFNWNLNPQYDNAFFSEFKIPYGALVYEIRKGTIVASYDYEPKP